MADTPPADQSADPLRAGSPPVMGERSRQLLLERQQARPSAEPTAATYRIPSLEKTRERPASTVRNWTIGLVAAFGFFWAVAGVAISLVFMGDGAAINHLGALGGVAITFYGGLCFWLAVALHSRARWAWRLTLGLSVYWALASAWGTLRITLSAGVLLAMGAFVAWALWTRKAQFLDEV